MQTLTESLRSVLGDPSFFVDGVIDYGLLIEYLLAGILFIFVVSSIFKFLRGLLK